MLFSALPNLGVAEIWYVAAIGLIFFSLQLLCVRVFLGRMKRHERELRTLLADLDSGGDGRDVSELGRRFPWLMWVDANFPRDSGTPSNYTRDDVLKELDSRIASDGYYLLLQRAGVMAPLLGVIITVLGFLVIRVPETEQQSLGDILYTVTPLVAGVGTGAILAFINQWLLHLASGKVEAVRNAARAWFDAAIWSGVGLDTQAATVKAITAIERMAKSVVQAAEQHDASVHGLRESVAAIQQASASFQQTHALFGDELRHLPAMLQELTDAAHAAVGSLQTLLPVEQRAAAGLDVAVATFRAAVENHFVEAAKGHQASIEGFAEAIGRINETAARLHVSSADLQETVNAHTNAFKSLNRSLQKQVLPAHEGFLAAMTQFNGRAEGVLERLEALHTEVAGALDKITALGPDAAAAIAAFSASTANLSETLQHRFAPATDLHRQQVESLSAALRQMQESTKGLADGGKAVEGLVKLQTHVSQGLGTVQGELRQAVTQLTETAGALRQSFDGDVAPSQHALHDATGALRDSARHLAAFIDRGLDPVTQRLTLLDETLTRFAGTVDVIRDFTDVRHDIERLSHSLAQAAAVADAITALPDQIRTLLEEVVQTHQEQQAQQAADARGSRWGWWRGRRTAR